MNEIDINALDLNILKVFEVLYEEGSATRSGVRLGLTQSAISSALSRLRQAYGDPLFTRTGRGLSPTLRAHELRPLIGEALAKCRQSLALMAPQGASFAGRSVMVGMSDDFEIAFARELVALCAQNAPGLRLAFRQTHSQIAVDMLQTRHIDLAVVAGGLTSRALSHEVLGESGYACVIDPASIPGGKRWRLDQAEYLRRDHLLISSGGFVGVVDEALARHGWQRRIVASSSHFAALPFLLKGTHAVATLPAHAAAALAALAGLHMRPCPVDLPHYAVMLGWRASALQDPAVASVKATLSQLLSHHPWQGQRT